MADEDPSKTNPALLIRLLKSDDKEAWEMFAKLYRARIQGWCRAKGLQESDAEDIAQTIVAEIHKKIPKYNRQQGRFRDWLYTATRNACLDLLKRRRPFDGGKRLEDVVAPGDLREELKRPVDEVTLLLALDWTRTQVTDRDWEVFHDLTLADPTKSSKEVASRLGLRVGTVSTIKWRVKGIVKGKIEELGGSEVPRKPPVRNIS
jgi:RNA polymerase sigma-70 factor (ECF subfamily)